MLIKEARWIADAVFGLPPEAFPLINIGSQTGPFRTCEQPWIDALIFAPLREAGRSVVHVDMKAEPGVDVVADVTTTEGALAVRRLGGRAVLCSNLLEHVEDPAGLTRDLAGLVGEDGWLIVTGPRRYPHHPDPIDNGFRPTLSELRRLFASRCEVVDATTIRGERMFRHWLAARRRASRGKARVSPDLRPGRTGARLRLKWLASRVWWAPQRAVAFGVTGRVR